VIDPQFVIDIFSLLQSIKAKLLYLKHNHNLYSNYFFQPSLNLKDYHIQQQFHQRLHCLVLYALPPASDALHC